METEITPESIIAQPHKVIIRMCYLMKENGFSNKDIQKYVINSCKYGYLEFVKETIKVIDKINSKNTIGIKV